MLEGVKVLSLSAGAVSSTGIGGFGSRCGKG